jgi:hypothetical protein
MGLALWIAALLWWDYSNEPRTLKRNLFVPMVEAFFSSTSALSRLTYPLHAGPYWLVMLERRKEFSAVLKRRTLVALGGGFALLFALGIVSVFALRVLLYYGYTSASPPSEPLGGHVQRTMAKQLPAMVVHRWVGLEGVLTVGAVANRSMDLLVTAIADNPKMAGQTLFQRVARVPYLADDPKRFTFLSNAGPVAILLFSGSFAVVFIGMALIGVVLVLTEEAARSWTGNPFLLAVAGAALANVVSQTTFFYLSLIFLLQMWIAIGFVAAVQRLRLGEPAIHAKFDDHGER